MVKHIKMSKDNKVSKKKLELLEESISSEISTDLIKKYIGYARQNCYPVLTEEAMKYISNFYVDLREKGRQANVYSATARQLEALIRLSEASAKIRLKDTVDIEDAQRAVSIFNKSMAEVSTDLENNMVDIDIINSGQSASQTSQMRRLLAIVREKSRDFDSVPFDDVIEEAKKEGMNPDKAVEFINQLKKKGEIYEPRHGQLKPATKEF